MTIKRILVPTDFSECATKAVDLAIPMAKRLDAEVLFLHLYPDPVGSLHVPNQAGHIRLSHAELGHIKSELDLLVRRAESIDVSARAVLVYDRGNESIDDYAESYRVDLIIMGTHGLRGLAEWFGGSNAQHVTRHTDVPVLVVKNEVDSSRMRNILFASSFEENVTAPLLFLTELAIHFDATIHLLYVNLAIHSIEREMAKKKMEDIVARFPDNRFTVNFGETNDEEFAINKAAERVGADLITLTPHDRDGVLRVFSHSIAENLVNHASIPVLVLPESD
jgi:nucleotide-binding universal stress UspA family protein